MRTLFWLPVLWATVLAGDLPAATIEFQVSTVGTAPSGQTLFRYNYFFSNLTLQQNQEIDIRFNPAQFGMLSNGVAGPGFSLLLLQPNNPPGAFGDFSALALVNNPPLSGPFSVDFTFIGSGQPGAQPFLINQLDANAGFVSTLESGTTVPRGQTVIPEPATFALGGAGLLMAGIFAIRRRFGGTARLS